MTLVDVIILVVVGGVIGWLGSIVMKTNAQMGLIANIIVGIVGMFLGSWLAGVIGIGADSQIVSILIGVGGAIVLILILKVLGVFK
jgi:uncharacterized membrane protein YeaQ/YmgE (transglycosylase-associated protein family)